MTDNWPHTSRPMPWLVAAFLVMLFLIPFDGITFKVHLPMDMKLDRVLIALMLVTIVAGKVTGSLPRARRRRTAVERAILIYVAIALVSIVLNIDRIFQLNELGFAEKTLSQFLGYVAFFFIVVATIRMEEFAAFAKLILVLCCVTAIGTLYEAHTGQNLFYEWAGKLFNPIATIIPAPTDLLDANGRPMVVGPTAHGLAVTSMLTMALPFAILPLLTTRKMRARVAYVVIIGLILAAELATARKTAFVAPFAAFVVLIAYNRRLLRWTPVLLLALIPVVHVAAPGAIGTLTGILGGGASSASTQGRLSDYGAVAPDLLNHLVIGSGYGVLDPDNYRWYRILDNEYLDQLFQVGIVGLVAYLSIVVTALTTAHRVIRRNGAYAPLALAAAAGCAAFGVVSATFDAAGFPQAPYTFMFAAALIVVAAVRQRQEEQRVQVSPTRTVTYGTAAQSERLVTARPPQSDSTGSLGSRTAYPGRHRGRSASPAGHDASPAGRLRRNRRRSTNTRAETRKSELSHEGTDDP